MNTRVWVLAAFVTAAALTVGPADSAAEKASKDVVDTALTAGQFKTLATALDKAGLVETLKGKGPFTLFAPTDKAFAKVPREQLQALLGDKDKLTKVLLAHVVVGKVVKAAEVLKLDGQKLNGYTIDARDGIKIGDAKVLKADIMTGNGVIHVIDAVLIPKQ